MLHRAGLDGIRSEGGRTVIGAMVPVQALVDHPVELLAETARHIADAEVRGAPPSAATSARPRPTTRSAATSAPR